MLKKIVGTIWRKMPPIARAKIIRLTQETFTVSAAAVITDKKGRILLLEHIYRPASGWGLPGGFISRGEQPEAAICRELREETGLKLENVKLLRVRVVKTHVEFIFRAQANGEPEFISREILRAQWFEVEKIPEEMPETQKRTIREVLG